ncbi:MAG: glycosyltransferase family 4 protein [Akkermansiaceae bacterium]
MKKTEVSQPFAVQSRIPILVFAHVPPPEHGQSRMVRLALDAMRADAENFDVHHVNARFSETLDEIGESSFRKGFLITKFLFQAFWTRLKLHKPVLYYVPGPVKWSAVIRDWFILGALRPVFPKVIFHWHAIGQGEWSSGSERVSLPGPEWLDRIARRLSGFFLQEPYASISVSEQSTSDVHAVGTQHPLIVCNGIKDPCSHFHKILGKQRVESWNELEVGRFPLFKVLFLSHGTVAKGLLDAIEALEGVLTHAKEDWRFRFTIAGGVSPVFLSEFEEKLSHLRAKGGSRLHVEVLGYLGESEKSEVYTSHDIFLSPSRWESFGLTTVEAMAHGMIVVGSSSDGIKGVLPPDYPYLTPPGHSTALSASLLRACKDIRDGKVSILSGVLRDRFLERFQLSFFEKNLRGAILRTCQALPVKGHAFGSPQKTKISVYLADQNPGYDRSIGISRMSYTVLKALHSTQKLDLGAIVSRTSQKPPEGVTRAVTFPWGTRRKLVRFLTDHLHPIFLFWRDSTAVRYYPKGYLPFFSWQCTPSVVTIHDTIIQFDEDHYPEWRTKWEYRYWAMMLKHTLRHSNWILTVSESSKAQIEAFMERHQLPQKRITVTYEPCVYDSLAQPIDVEKKEFVIHLASVEPHKRTAHLIEWWVKMSNQGVDLPVLHLIGSIPESVKPLVASSERILKRPFLDDQELQTTYRQARALILPSEIEGFGLPALEAYYLGTPVCFVEGTSVQEVLGVATSKGGMSLEDPKSLLTALDEVLSMSPDEISHVGIKLREVFSLDTVSGRMLKVFQEISKQYS